MIGKVGRAGADEQGRDYRVRPDSVAAASYPRSAGRRIARLCNGMLLGRRSDLANPQSLAGEEPPRRHSGPRGRR